MPTAVPTAEASPPSLSSCSPPCLTVARETVFANLTTAVSVFAGAVFLREPLNRTGLLCRAVILPGICGVRHGSRQEAA